MPGAVQDLFTHPNSGEDRLKSFGVAMGRILSFSADMPRRHLKHYRTIVQFTEDTAIQRSP